MLACSEVVLFGEVHDNPIHHAIRAAFLGTKWGFGKWPPDCPGLKSGKSSLIFEQFRTDKQPALDAFADLRTKSPEQATLPEFKRLTDWEKSGWQQYNYDPLLQAALDAKLPLYAGDVPRASMMKVAKEGEGALPADERARLKLDTPLGPKLDDASLTELVESHCNTMPKEAMGGMAYAQRYRDATLADNVLKAAGKHGSAILIAGNGHVRTDRGVPWYIRQRAPDKKVVSVMLIEVEDGKTDPEAYVPRDPDGKPAADYIIFTPRAEREDPCEKMRAGRGK
ncbi:MAG: ChaN family lipoprotein [Hyphomicrobium sp.]